MNPISNHPLEKEAYNLSLEEENRLLEEFGDDENVHLHFDTRWLILFRPFGGGIGFTFGNNIYFYGGKASHKEIAHEYVHVKQYRKYGIAKFLYLYLKGFFFGKGEG